MDLNTIWYVLLTVLLIGYAVLDGFDLGVGMLHLFVKGDRDRRISLNSIGPVWDGNEVWLVVSGGALFAAFPEAYATAFSGFYDAFILLLFTLIFRGVAIEFRSKRPSRTWRFGWDIAFSVASFGAALLLGIAYGNLARGVTLDDQRNMVGGLTEMLNPFSLLVGVTAVALLALHGAIYLLLKTENELHDRVRTWVKPLMISFIVLYGITTIATLMFHENLVDRFRDRPGLFVVPLATLLVIANIPREIHLGRDFRAFLSSASAIALLMTLIAIGQFPTIIHCRTDQALSLTAYNAASTPKTLTIMLIIALLAMPLVLAYTTLIYWVFRGKVRLDDHSY
jgi:cytochrome d ubiquinol oxidase subunit II